MNASDVMSRNVVTITRDTLIREAIRLMLVNKISGLPVIDREGRIEGILTEGDLLRRGEIATEKPRWPWLDFLLGPGRLAAEYIRTHGRLCEALMSRNVVSVEPAAPLGDIVALMERHRIKRVPVIENGNLIGIVSRADLLAAIARVLDTPQVAADSDAALRERVLAELAKTDWAPRAGLSVSVADGIVTFDGVILDEHARGALRVLAENTPGVKGVTDRLTWVEPVSGTVIGNNPD